MAQGGGLSAEASEEGGLCLTRKRGERILIGDHIVIDVLKVKGSEGAVVLRIVAPGMIVDRSEVRDRVRAEGRRRDGRAKTR